MTFKRKKKIGSKNYITEYINEPFEINLKLNGQIKSVNILPLSFYILLSGLKEYNKKI